MGYKQIENTFKALFSNAHQKKPSDSTIRLWIMRLGYAKLKKELPDGQWILIGDVTVVRPDKPHTFRRKKKTF